MSRQIWTIFLVQKRFRLLGCKTQSIQGRWQQQVLICAKSYNGRGKFQAVYAIEESAGQCGRKVCKRGNIDASADTYNVQRHWWTTQTGSQGSWRSGPSKQKDLCDSAEVQCGQHWEFLCSSPTICKEEGGREVSTSCLCEFSIWTLY